MAVKIRLKRLGKMRAPYYRIVVADARTKRDGRAIEEIGKYHPTEEPSFIEVDRERAQYWLGVGAQPTEQVAALLKITGDWQTFRGEPGGEGTLKVKEPKTPVAAPTLAPKTEAPAPKGAAARSARDEKAPAATEAPASATETPAAASEEPAAAPADAAQESAPTSVDEVAATPPAEAETANDAQPDGTDEPAEAGSAGTND